MGGPGDKTPGSGPRESEPSTLRPDKVGRRGGLADLDYEDDAATTVGVDPALTMRELEPAGGRPDLSSTDESLGVAAFRPGAPDSTRNPEPVVDRTVPSAGIAREGESDGEQANERRPSRRGPVSTRAQSLVGKVLAKRYRLLSVIGEGGMGTVYEAEHVDIGKRVAIKVLTAMPRQRDEAAARFLREARAVSRVESEHVVQVFDVGDENEIGLYMVMELLRGEDLEKIVAIRGGLSPKLASAIVLQASQALEKAHGAGIVHRDLKPANVFLTRVDDGSYRVKIVDFGIAKLLRAIKDAGQHGRMDITRSGTSVGTPQYMSPEQARGEDEIDHRTDIYSLGAVFYEALVGAPAVPPLNSYEATILHVVTNFAPRVSEKRKDVPASLVKLVSDMMQNALGQRIASAQSVRKRLLAVYPDLDTLRITLDKAEGVVESSRSGAPTRTTDALTVDSDRAAGRAAKRGAEGRPRGRKRGIAARIAGLVGAMIFGGVLAVTFLATRRETRDIERGPGSTPPPTALEPAAKPSAAPAAPAMAPPIPVNELPRAPAPVVAAPRAAQSADAASAPESDAGSEGEDEADPEPTAPPPPR